MATVQPFEPAPVGMDAMQAAAMYGQPIQQQPGVYGQPVGMQPQPGAAMYIQPMMGQPMMGQQPMMMAVSVNLPPSVMAQMSMLPVSVQCPFCQKVGMTEVEKKVGGRLIISACALSCMGCCLCLPLCWDQLKDHNHHCSNCKQFIGMYKPPRHGGGRRRGRR